MSRTMAGPTHSVPTLVEFLLGRDLETAPALRCAVLAHCLAASTLPATYWAAILGAVGTTPVCENVVVEVVSTFKDDPDVIAWADKACHNANMPLSTRLRLCREMAVPFQTDSESLETLPSLDEPFYETPVKGIKSNLGGRKLGSVKAVQPDVAKPSRSLASQGSKRGAKGTTLALPSTKGLLRKTMAGKIALKKATKLKEATAGPTSKAKVKVCIHRLPYTFQGTENTNFSKRNPKQKGTEAYKRYQKYMRARTVTAALNLGASKRDLVFDFHRGHLQVSPKK